MSELSKFNNIAGKTFGKWLAVKECGKAKNGSTLWLFRCECGTEKIRMEANVFTGKSLSCKPCQKFSTGKAEQNFIWFGDHVQRCVNQKTRVRKLMGPEGINVM